MSRFPIFDVHCNLLERIVSKLPGRSYLEIQQTCRDMAELIQNNRKITASVNKSAILDWEPRPNGRRRLVVTVNGEGPIDLESLYGCRFSDIQFSEEIDTEFEQFCSILKKYRITCDQLELDFFGDEDGPPKEQCIELLKILKPSEVIMESRKSNLFEALASWSFVRRVNVLVSPGDAIPALQIISQVPRIQLDVRSADEGEEYKAEQFCRVLERILQFLRSTLLPNLRSFICTMTCDEDLPPIEERLRQLSTFQPTLLRGPDQFKRHAYQCTFGQDLVEVTLSPRGAMIVSTR